MLRFAPLLRQAGAKEDFHETGTAPWGPGELNFLGLFVGRARQATVATYPTATATPTAPHGRAPHMTTVKRPTRNRPRCPGASTHGTRDCQGGSSSPLRPRRHCGTGVSRGPPSQATCLCQGRLRPSPRAEATPGNTLSGWGQSSRGPGAGCGERAAGPGARKAQAGALVRRGKREARALTNGESQTAPDAPRKVTLLGTHEWRQSGSA